MGAGVRVWDASSNLLLDQSTPVGKFVGSFTTDGNETGGFVDSAIIGRRFFYFAVSPSGAYGGPVVTAVSGSGSISWDYSITLTGTSSVSSSDRIHTIYYGFY